MGNVSGAPTYRDANLITPREAVNRLSPLVGGDLSAKKILAERIKDGEFFIRAEWCAHQADVGAFPDEIPTESSTKWGKNWAFTVTPYREERRTVVTDGIWNTSQNWEQDVSRWQWGRGNLVASAAEALRGGPEGSWSPQTHLPTRWIVAGAKFPENAIDEIRSQFGWRVVESTAAGAPSHSPRHYDPKAEWWDWVAEVALLVYEGGIIPTTKANSIIDITLASAAEKDINVPSRSTLYPAAQKIAEAFRKWGDRH